MNYKFVALKESDKFFEKYERGVLETGIYVVENEFDYTVIKDTGRYLTVEFFGTLEGCKRYLEGKTTVEEINSAALLGLVQAVSRFDESRGLKFSTFAVPTIVGTIKGDFYKDKSKFIRRIKEGKEIYERINIDSLNRIVPLEKDAEVIDYCSSQFDMDKEIENFDLQIAISKLDELQRKIINMIYFEGKSQCEIARLLKTSQPTISKINTKALQILRESITA